MVYRGGNTSKSTPMKIPTVNVPINNISSTNTLVLVGTVSGSNPGNTSTSYMCIPTGGCTLPNMGFPYGGDYQGQNLQAVNVNPFGQPNTCLGSTSRWKSTPWNGNIPSGGNGPWNMNTNWRNHPQMSGNAPRDYPPTNPCTMFGGNPTPPTTTMLGGIPPINPMLNWSSMYIRGHQSFKKLPPQGGNPHLNASQLLGK